MDLVANFVNSSIPLNEHAASRELNCFAWLPAEKEELNDTRIAIGGNDTLIHIISLGLCKVTTVLQGHTGAITDLKLHPNRPVVLVLSASRDKTIRLWHVDAAKCLAIFHFETPLLAIHPSGSRFVCAGKGGALREFDIPLAALGLQPQSKSHKKNVENDYASPLSSLSSISDITENRTLKKHHQTTVDCVRYLSDGQIVSKSVGGRIYVWNSEDGEVYKEFRVKNPSESSSDISHFDISRCEKFICAGNSQGSVFIFSMGREGSAGNSLLKTLSHRRAHTPIRACAFSHDCRNVLIITSEPYIWRWDYISPELLAQHQQHDK